MIPMSHYYSLNNPTVQANKQQNERLDIIRKQYQKFMKRPTVKVLGYGNKKY